MYNLSIINNETMTMTSRDLALVLNREHKHIIRSITDIIQQITLSPEMDLDLYFVLEHYNSTNGRKSKSYTITERGFMLFICSINKFHTFKMEFIDEFARLRTENALLLEENVNQSQLLLDQANEYKDYLEAHVFTVDSLRTILSCSITEVYEILNFAGGYFYRNSNHRWTPSQESIDDKLVLITTTKYIDSKGNSRYNKKLTLTKDGYDLFRHILEDNR